MIEPYSVAIISPNHIGQDLNFDKRAIYYWSKQITEQLLDAITDEPLK